MTTIIFPGQGSQYLDMAKDIYESSHISKEVFDIVEETTKINISKIIFSDSDNLLNQTQFTQLAIFTASISIFNVLKNEIGIKNRDISYMLGHSLGEYTALAAAEILSIQDCATLLKKRGDLMQNAYKPNQSGMAAVIGMDCNAVEKLINKEFLKVEIANDNSPMQIVISGINNDLLFAENIFIKNGAKKFIMLNVSSAFHSKLMLGAENKLQEYINNINFSFSDIKIISNFNADVSKNIESIIFNLSNQMSNRVRWVESISLLDKLKEIDIIEIGPGKVLSGLIKRISKNFSIKSINNLTDIREFNK